MMYGSSFCGETEIPRLLSTRPTEATVIPLPMLDTTPPVTNMYFVSRLSALFSRADMKRRLERVTGALLIALGLRLVWERR